MAGELIREQAAALDAEDPLAPFRARFAIDEDGPLYADGNSLGRPTHASIATLTETADDWARRLVGAWEDWIEAPQRIGDLLAEHVLGARPGEVVACDSTTVNLFKLAGAVLAEEPGPIAALSDDFPTDRYVLQGLAAAHGVDLRLVSRAQIPHAARDARLVCLSHVDYRSGEVAEMAALRAPNGYVLWDLSHSAGAVELDLHGAGADLAVGCSYKYLNGGPGAPAWLYVRSEHQGRLRSPIQGWFGQRDQFDMGLRYEPADGIARFLAGTPPMLALLAMEPAIRLIGQAGMPVVAAKTRALTELFVYLHDEWLAPLGFVLGSPRGARARGGHVALRHEGVADRPRADRARPRRPRLPRAGHDPLRVPGALHAVRRRRRRRAAHPRRRRVRRARARRRLAAPGHVIGMSSTGGSSPRGPSSIRSIHQSSTARTNTSS